MVVREPINFVKLMNFYVVNLKRDARAKDSYDSNKHEVLVRVKSFR